MTTFEPKSTPFQEFREYPIRGSKSCSKLLGTSYTPLARYIEQKKGLSAHDQRSNRLADGYRFCCPVSCSNQSVNILKTLNYILKQLQWYHHICLFVTRLSLIYILNHFVHMRALTGHTFPITHSQT
jgi:hypothetical protein